MWADECGVSGLGVGVNRVAQYLPAFVSDEIARASASADTRAELEALPFVKQWTADPAFHRLSLSDAKLRAPWDRDAALPALMAEMDGGARWYVVAGLERPALYDLPTWEAP